MVTFKNFSFKQSVTYCSDALTEIPLTKQGAVYIGGSNGAGKSLPFNVFFNVLFGHTPLSEDRSKRKLIANKNYDAQVDLQIGDSDYSIRQFFNNEDLGDGYDIWKGGQSLKLAGGIPKCEKYIAELLPFKDDEFGGFYYLSQDMLHTLAYGTGAKRLEYLSRIFGFDIYDKLRAALKKELDAADLRLVDAAKAQEEVDRIDQILKNYPSLEILDRRMQAAKAALTQAKEAKAAYEKAIEALQTQLDTLTQRNRIEKALAKYTDVRASKDVLSQINTVEVSRAASDKIVVAWQQKVKLEAQLAPIAKFASQDIAKLTVQIDALTQKKGKALSYNRDVTRRVTLESDITRYKALLKVDREELPMLLAQTNTQLVEKQKSYKDNNAVLKSYTTLEKDGGKCSRCNHPLDSEHIKLEVGRLREENKVLEHEIQELENLQSGYQTQMDLVARITECEKVWEAIEYKGDRIDLEKLEKQLFILKDTLEKAKEASRLVKELKTYEATTQAGYAQASEMLSTVDAVIAKLREEYARAKQRDMLQQDLSKLDLKSITGTEETITESIVQQKNEIKALDDTIPAVTAEMKEAETLDKVVQEYLKQREVKEHLASQADKLHKERRIVNACYKAYAPSNLKKEEVSKISNLIAEKLNIFVPLVFPEDIQFTSAPDEGAVDILFKRGDQPLRDVRYLNGGYKKRFLISLIPTLASLVPLKKRSNLIILDEVDANMDRSGRDAIGEFLVPYLKEKFETVILISPCGMNSDGTLDAPIPLDHFDKIWLATYKDEKSTLNIK